MKRKCMKRLFLLALVAVITVAFFSCSDGGEDKNEGGKSDVSDETSGKKSNVVELSIYNESSYDLADVSWRGIAFYSSVDGRTLPSSSVAKNNVEVKNDNDGGYVFFTRCGTVPAKLRTYDFVNAPADFRFLDDTKVVEVGNIKNEGSLSNIKLSVPDYYMVSFESDGEQYIEPYTVQRGKEITVAPEVQKDGVAFAGWYSDKDFKHKVEFPYVPEADTVLYAEWKSPPQPVPFTGTRNSSTIKIQITPSDDKYFDCYQICCCQEVKYLFGGEIISLQPVLDTKTKDFSYEIHKLDWTSNPGTYKDYVIELYVVDTFGQQSEMYSKSF